MTDRSSLLGLRSLVNIPDAPDIDLDELETDVVGKNDPLDSFERTLNSIDTKRPSRIEDQFPSQWSTPSKPESTTRYDVGNLSNMGGAFSKSFNTNSGVNIRDGMRSSPMPSRMPPMPQFTPIDFQPKDKALASITEEERKAQIADRVFGEMKDMEDFDIQKETDEEEKAELIEEIETLADVLKDEGIDISRIRLPTIDDDMNQIMRARHLLRLKNDRIRSRIFAEEVILASAQGFEHFFDGKKEYFGKRPDLRGWHNTVNIKLRKMRFESSMFVNSMVKTYNISPGIRLLLELLPSMFLYSRTRKRQHNDELMSSVEMSDAMNRIEMAVKE